MSWNHIQNLMNDLGGPAIIVEDGEPRYVVVPVQEWERLQERENDDVSYGVEYEDVEEDDESQNPIEDYSNSTLENEESPFEALDTFETPSYPV